MGKISIKTTYTDTDGGRMKLFILSPKKKSEKPSAGILWLHGGGYALGFANMVLLSRAKPLVKKYGVTVISPEYRLSGKAPYPAAFEDCYKALLYMKNNAEALNIRQDQLMVGGESAGGGLAAALSLAARDRGEVKLAYQMPLYPMLDDRDTETSRDNHAPLWNTRRNRWAWRKYLRGLTDGEATPKYAAPARETNYEGLPPAYTFIGDIEPFYAESHTYFDNLTAAGVEAVIDDFSGPFPGCFHSFDTAMPWRKESKEAIRRFEERFEYALNNYFAPQK